MLMAVVRTSFSPRPADAILAAAAASALAGLGIARLTMQLNPHLAGDLSDKLLLHLYLAGLYGVMGALPGTVGAALIALARRFKKGSPLIGVGVVSALALAPLGCLLLLPGSGLGSPYLTSFLSAPTWRQALDLALITAGLAVVGWGLAAGLAALVERLGTTVRRFGAVAWTLAAAVLLLAGLLHDPVDDSSPEDSGPVPAETLASLASPAPGALPPRVVLLCIDGADLDDVIEPMVEAGELPTFARLMREGTWGPLETFEPTLSAVVWTSVITGKTAAAHGIHHFLHFRLPGIRQAVYEFPLHSGLNFHIFPWLEKVPGMPAMRAPYTSNMRRAEALWDIVGQRYKVGAYRWLVSWPAEEINGFSVAGGLGWVQFSHDGSSGDAKEVRGRAVYPPQLRRALARWRRPPLTQRDLAPYVGGNRQLDWDDRRLEPILKSFANPAARELPRLIAEFDVRFAAASFFPVDGFHHYFNAYRGRGGLFSDAIAERYRFTDARLGEFLETLREALGEPAHVIVISDHGYDFEHNHHTYAPQGVFFAHGPAFEAGRRVDGLSVYDVAPLVLRLLDMPLPDDMPGSRSGTYRSALSSDFLDAHPDLRIATYETSRPVSHESVESPKDEEIRKVLESLGYVD